MDSERIAALNLKLKKNKLIRLFFYPFQNIKRKRLLKKYEKSEYSKALLKFKNMYKDKRCFIIGNGPSLKPEDLDKLKNEYTFASNKIFYMFNKTSWRPTFYCCIDPEVIVSIGNQIQSIESEYKFFEICHKPPKSSDKNYIYLYTYSKFYLDKFKVDEPYISEHPEKNLSNGLTVTFTAIQLAIFMGFKEIFLLGVDHNYSQTGKDNYFNGAPNTMLTPPPSLNVLTKAYTAARKYCDEHDIKIYNATRGGKLEAFERVNFDDIIF